LIDSRQTKYAYWVSAVGVALTAATTVYGMLRVMLQPGGRPSGNPKLGNMTIGNLAAIEHMNRGGMNPFGLTDSLTIVAIIIAIVGLAWLGLILLKSKKSAASNNQPANTPVVSSLLPPTT
jgi:hypothetical protein